MTKKELEVRVAELEKEVQMANRHNEEYVDICKSYSELVDTLKSECDDTLEENKKLKAEIEKLKEAKKESVEEVKPEPKFKVGDRVKCVKHWYKTYLIGKVGTIKKLLKGGSYIYTVDFDEYIGGHNGGGTCKPGHGSQIREDCLELVKEEPKFKVGDRVKCVKERAGLGKVFGKSGTITYIDYFCYSIEWDEDIDGHNCSGHTKPDHGWWVGIRNEDVLELVKPEPKFKVGDRVTVLSCGRGTVKGIDPEKYGVHTFAIEFDKSIGPVGHTCSGLCKDRHGLWVHEDLIKPIDEKAELKRNVLTAMRICSDDYLNCSCCPYHGREENCSYALYKDAIKLLED